MKSYLPIFLVLNNSKVQTDIEVRSSMICKSHETNVLFGASTLFRKEKDK